jgi:hypothetical protein
VVLVVQLGLHHLMVLLLILVAAAVVKMVGEQVILVFMEQAVLQQTD